MIRYKIVHTLNYLLAIKNSNLQKDDMTYLKRKDGGYMFLKVVIFPLEEEYCKSTKQVWLQEIGKNYTQTIQKQGNKIVAYLPLTGKTLKGIPLLPELSTNTLASFARKCWALIYGEYRERQEKPSDIEWNEYTIQLYNEAKSAMGIKEETVYTIEDIRKAIDCGLTMSTITDKPFTSKEFKILKSSMSNAFIQSLTKYPVAIEVEDEFKTGKYIY